MGESSVNKNAFNIVKLSVLFEHFDAGDQADRCDGCQRALQTTRLTTMENENWQCDLKPKTTFSKMCVCLCVCVCVCVCVLLQESRYTS